MPLAFDASIYEAYIFDARCAADDYDDATAVD